MTFICQVTRELPKQCSCGESEAVYLCEVIAPPGHKHRIGEHTILHARMGNGYSCLAIEARLND